MTATKKHINGSEHASSGAVRVPKWQAAGGGGSAAALRYAANLLAELHATYQGAIELDVALEVAAGKWGRYVTEHGIDEGTAVLVRSQLVKVGEDGGLLRITSTRHVGAGYEVGCTAEPSALIDTKVPVERAWDVVDGGKILIERGGSGFATAMRLEGIKLTKVCVTQDTSGRIDIEGLHDCKKRELKDGFTEDLHRLTALLYEKYVWRDKRTKQSTRYVRARYRGEDLAVAITHVLEQDGNTVYVFDDFIEGIRAEPPAWTVEDVNWLARFGAVVPDAVAAQPYTYKRPDGTERTLDFMTFISLLTAVQILSRTEFPGCRLREFPMLAGREGIGKSAFAAHLLPDDCDSAFSEIDSSVMLRMKDSAEALQGVILVEIAEKAGHGQMSNSARKGYMTRLKDKVRVAFGRKAGDNRRTFTFVLTTNDIHNMLPNDPGGNTRYVPLKLTQGFAVEAYLDKHRRLIFAAAMEVWEHMKRQDPAVAKGKVGARVPREWMVQESWKCMLEDARSKDDRIVEGLETFEAGGIISAQRTDKERVQEDDGTFHYRWDSFSLDNDEYQKCGLDPAFLGLWFAQITGEKGTKSWDPKNYKDMLERRPGWDYRRASVRVSVGGPRLRRWRWFFDPVKKAAETR